MRASCAVDNDAEFIRRTLADAIERDPKLSSDALAAKLQHKGYADWIDESRDIAERVAHSGIKGVTKEQIKADPEHKVPFLPNGYQQAARTLANERAALAGDRLSDKLAAIFSR